MLRFKANYLIFIIIFILAFFVYFITAYPDVGPTDSGELTLAAWSLGVAHPPGAPFYVFLGWLWTHILPFAKIAWRLNLFSAFTSAITIALFFLISSKLLIRRGSTYLESLIGGTVCASILFLSNTLWNSSTVSEVYSLNTLIVASLIFITLYFIPNTRFVIYSALLFGVGLAVHPVSCIFIFPLIFCWIIFSKTNEILKKSLIFILTASLVITLAYLFLYWRAQANPVLNWGNPSSLTALWRHITASQYHVISANNDFNQHIFSLASSFSIWISEFNIIIWLFSLFGWVKEGFKNRTLGRGFLGVLFFTFIYIIFFRPILKNEINEDLEYYYLPLIATTAIGSSFAFGYLIEYLKKEKKSLIIPFFCFCLIFPLTLIISRWHKHNQSVNTISADYAYDSINNLPSNALVISSYWQLNSPLLYKQGVENFRPDVAIIDLELFRNRPWYIEQIIKKYPDLGNQWTNEINEFLPELSKFERGKIQGGQEFFSVYQNLLAKVMQTKDREIYLDIFSVMHFQENQVALSGVAIPEGLFYHIYRNDNAPKQLPKLNWRLGAINNPNLKLAPVEIEIRKHFRAMLYNRADYLNKMGDTEGSKEAWEIAKQIVI